MDDYNFFDSIVKYVMSTDDYKARYDYFSSHYSPRVAYVLLQFYIFFVISNLYYSILDNK